MGVRKAVGVGAGLEVAVEVEAGVRAEVEVEVGATKLRLKQCLDMCPGAFRDLSHHRIGHVVAAYHQIAWTRVENSMIFAMVLVRCWFCLNAYLRSLRYSSYRNPAFSTKAVVPRVSSTYPLQPASSQYSPCSNIPYSSS